MTLGNDNGTDGRRTDRRTDRVRRNMRPPPSEEGRIIKFKLLYIKFDYYDTGIETVNSLRPWNIDLRLDNLV